QPLLDLPMPVHELSPQGHVLKPTVDRMSARQVRLRKQATIGFEIVKPRRPEHLPRVPLGLFDVVEQRGQLGDSPALAVARQWRGPIRFGILEMQADGVAARERIGKAAEGGHDWWGARPLRSSQVEAICPFVSIARLRQPGQILLPDRMSRIEAAPETKANEEVGVLEHRARERESGQSGHPQGKLELEVEEGFGVSHGTSSLN